jgi:hypothetical protein
MRATRRDFLGALGASAFLPLLDADRASAQSYPLRFIVFGKNNGMHIPAFFPAAPAGGEARLDAITLPPILQTLDRRKNDVMVLGNVEQTSFKDIPNFNGHHSCGHNLTGIADKGSFLGGGVSLDQYIAAQFAKTVNLPFPTLNLGASASGVQTMAVLSYRGAAQPVSNENSATNAFNRLFGSLNLSAAEQDRLRRERKSVLDYLGARLTAFGARLGSEDRQKIDYHLGSVRDLEKRLSATAGKSCTAPTITPVPSTDTSKSLPQMIQAQMDNIVAAMACDLTRVATLKASSAGDHAMLWLGAEFQRAGIDNPKAAATYHDITHHQYGETKDLKIRADQWWLEMLMYLLDKLDAVKEGAGTMLDNTLVLMVDDMGNGAVHAQGDMPFVLAGRLGGRIKMGRYLNPGRKVAHNGVLVAVANAFGFPVTTFGDPKYGGAYPGVLA